MVYSTISTQQEEVERLAGRTGSRMNNKRLGFKPQIHRSIYSRNCIIYSFLLCIESSLNFLKLIANNIIPPH